MPRLSIFLAPENSEELSSVLSHLVFEQVADFGAHCVCLVLLVVRLEDAELFLVRDGKSNKRRQESVLYAALELTSLLILAH